MQRESYSGLRVEVFYEESSYPPEKSLSLYNSVDD